MGDLYLYRDSIRLALMSVKSALKQEKDMLYTNNTDILLKVEKLLSQRIEEVDKIILEESPEMKKILKKLKQQFHP